MRTRLSRGSTRSARGFSLVEALISLTILAASLAVTMAVFQTSRRAGERASVAATAQQNARVSSSTMTKELRAIGRGIDEARGQQALVHAGPWDLIFCANILPRQDDVLNPGAPAAIDLGLEPSRVPPNGGLYEPDDTFRTGAETIRYTLDSTGDGEVDAEDSGDDPEEENPGEYLLIEEVYGALPDGTNGGTPQAVAVVQGPPVEDESIPAYPLFTYWLDDDADPATEDVLHGDLDGDGSLSAFEVLELETVGEDDLPLVTRIVVSTTGRGRSAQSEGRHIGRGLETSVTLRNQNRRKAVIYGMVFEDEDGDGVFDFDEDEPLSEVPITLGTQKADVSDDDGEFAFSVDAGEYRVAQIVPQGMEATTPVAAVVTAGIGEAVYLEFGLREN